MFSYTACPDSSGKSRNVGKTSPKTLFLLLLLTQICFGQWYPQNSGTTQHLYAVQFVDANKGWAVGDSGTIIHTTNAGETWLQQNSGTHHPLLNVSFINSNKGWAVGYSGDWSNPDSAIIINTTDGGLNWNTQFSILGKFYEVCFTSEHIGYVFGNTVPNYCTSIVAKTTDGGSTWSYVYQPAELGSFGCFFNDNIGWRVYSTGIGNQSPSDFIYKTTDGGVSWAVQDTFRFYVSKLKSFDGNFCVAVGGMIEKPRGLIAKTYNGGSDWTVESLWTPGPLGIKDLWNVSISSIDVITMIEDSRIIRSTDSGTTWSIQPIYPDVSLRGISFTDENTGWVVGENGIIYHTINGGVPVELTSFTATSNGKEVILNWGTATETNNNGFSIERKSVNLDYTEIAFVPGYGTTTEPKSYTYTDSEVSTGKYTYRLKQIDFDGSYEYSPEVEVEIFAPMEFALDQNYPNPFNPSTVISWQVPVGSHQVLKVFDVLGNEIATLVDEYKPAGRFEVEFNVAQVSGLELASGIYFYQLRAGDNIAVKKMILIK